MNMIKQVNEFISALADYESEHVFNPWRDYDERYDISKEAPRIRRENLRDYLLPRLGKAPYIIVAEAVGYQGGRFTGIAITCERMLLGHHPTITPDIVLDRKASRTSNPESPFIEKKTQKDMGFNEPTDTVVWNALVENKVDPKRVLLWNIFPFHPHKAGEPLSNRTPTEEELIKGFAYTKTLLEMNGQSMLLAVGQKAAQTLETFHVKARALRHPANGGAGKYRAEFRAIVNGQG